MSFGKPRLSDKLVRCLNCGEEYPEHEVMLKHAGRTEEGDFWNDVCPECGVHNAHIDSGDLSDGAFIERQHEVARHRQEARREQRGGRR